MMPICSPSGNAVDLNASVLYWQVVGLSFMRGCLGKNAIDSSGAATSDTGILHANTSAIGYHTCALTRY